MDCVIKPKIKPPKIDDDAVLSEDAQKIIKALRQKYALRIKDIASSCSELDLDLEGNSNSVIPTKDRPTTNYYKYIYDATFKKENVSQASVAPTQKALNLALSPSFSSGNRPRAHRQHDPSTPAPRHVIGAISAEASSSSNKHHGGFNFVQTGLTARKGVSKINMWTADGKSTAFPNIDSPPIDIIPSSCLDEEEVICDTQLPQTSSESPISSQSERFHLLLQQSSRYNSNKNYTNSKRGERRVDQSLVRRVDKDSLSIPPVEDPLAPFTSVAVNSDVSAVLFGTGDSVIPDFTEVIPGPTRLAFSPRQLEIERRNGSLANIEEIDFNLELPGSSPLMPVTENSLNAEESPLQLSQISLPKERCNFVLELPESPLSLRVTKSKESEPSREMDFDTGLDRGLKQSYEVVKLSSKRETKRNIKTTSFLGDDGKSIANLGSVGNESVYLKRPTIVQTEEVIPKKKKSRFLPPSQRSASTTLDVNDKKCPAFTEDRREKEPPYVIQLFSLSQREQKKALSSIESCQYLCLTIVCGSGQQGLINTFYKAADYAKKKSLAGKSDSTVTSPSSVMILTPKPMCYELKIVPSTVEAARLILCSLLNDETCEKIIVNLKEFLIFICKDLNCDIRQEIHCKITQDPVIASWLLNPDVQPASFSHLCQTSGFTFAWLHQEGHPAQFEPSLNTIRYHVIVGGVNTYGTLFDMKKNKNKVEWLSCLGIVPKVMKVLKESLTKEKLWDVYEKIEMKLIPLLAYMECCSLKVNMKTFIRYSDIIKGKLRQLEDKAYDLVGHKFSINSHPQLRQVLYEELKLDKKMTSKSEIGKTTVAHHKSTSESALNLMTDVHPLPQVVLQYRTLQKMLSTYVEGLMSCVVDGYVSTHWDQTAAATGRLTSSQPNVQTVPKVALSIADYKPRNKFAADPNATNSMELFAREPFVSRDGRVFLAADFQQVELRLLAHLTGEKTLLSLFWKPDTADVFNLLTSEWHGKSVNAVTCEEREQTKRVVYSVMYGVGKDRLSEYLKISPDSAKDIMNSFLVRFPCINAFSKKCTAFAEEHGYTETLCGRKRYFPNIKSYSPALKAQAQRQAVNFCVQGSAADVCKLAMLAVESKLSYEPQLQCRLLLQIHDELVWEVSENQLFQIKKIIEGIMENTNELCSEFCDLQVPLTASFSYGKSWAHLTPMNNKTQKAAADIDNM